MSRSSPLYHQITQKILVIGPSGCGKTSLIESILSRTNCPYQYHRQSSTESTNCNEDSFKQYCYSQKVIFRELEIKLKVFERTCNGLLSRHEIQPYYNQLDVIIGVYDSNQTFQMMRQALDSILALYNGPNCKHRPTLFVLGNVRNHRRCRSDLPCTQIKNYLQQIEAIPLFNYCYSSRHIKAFHHLFMLNIYRQTFGTKHFNDEQSKGLFQKAIENCRNHKTCDSNNNNYSNYASIRNLIKRICLPFEQMQMIKA